MLHIWQVKVTKDKAIGTQVPNEKKDDSDEKSDSEGFRREA
jgi:hypothetical protein